jgi:membrane protein implicated in regulation of membrane protease activity
MGVFALFTLISLFLVRPFALRYLHKNDDPRPSNADALIGRKGRVVEAIPADGFGRVAIDGDVWKAVSATGTEIPRGANVIVKSMESITVTVEEI